MSEDETSRAALVERVAAAISNSPNIWLSRNRHAYYEWDVCRYGIPPEPEVVILEQHHTHTQACQAQTRLIRSTRAEAAISAMEDQSND